MGGELVIEDGDGGAFALALPAAPAEALEASPEPLAPPAGNVAGSGAGGATIMA